MKKALGLMLALYVCVGLAIADMDDVEYSANDLKPSYAQTNSFVMRGWLESIVLTASGTESAGVSNTVSITCDNETLFSYNCTNDQIFYPRTQMDTYAGGALANLSVTNADGVITTNKIYDKFPVAGKVTVTQTALGPATNDWKVKLVFWK